MSNLVSYNQNDYLSLQVAPPMASDHSIQPLIQHSSPTLQQQLQVQPRSVQPSPRPNEYGQNTSTPSGIGYPLHPPPSPFDWIVSTITSLLHSQHTTMLTKLNEDSEKHISLASKVEALQQSTNSLQQTVNTILESMQQVSDKVAKLGADMSSRDATLAERLNALDDAIEAWSADAKLASGTASRAPPVGELQTPPVSDELIARSQSGTQDMPEQGQELQSLNKIIQDADSLNDNNYPIQPESNGNISLSRSQPLQLHPRLSSAPKDTSPSTPMAQQTANRPNIPGRGRKSTGCPFNARMSVRRSGRQSKKRQRNDGTIETPISKKKAKTVTRSVPKNEPGVGGKVPGESTLSQFDWQSVPIQDEELEQLIYCDKCDQAYHWGCVNILPEDPILQDDTWLCPPCEFEDQHGSIPGRTHDLDAKCRPDCPVQDQADDMFAIDAIIGRFPHSADPSGAMMQYLVKWDDYPVQRATWTPENEIGQAVHVLIRDFEKAASKENLDVSDKSQLILLQEARDGGWGYYTFPS